MSETKKVIKMKEAQNNKESYTTVYVVQYSNSIVQNSIVQYIQYIQYSIVLYIIVQYSLVQYLILQYIQ